MFMIHKLEVKVRVSLTFGKAQARHKTIDSSIPSSSSLLQPVPNLLQLIDMYLSVFNFKSFGRSMYTSSSITPFRKVVFPSIWCNFHFVLAASAMMVLIEVYLATGANVSS